VFFGTPDFAVPSLEALTRDGGIDVCLVVTQPDRPAGRGRRLTPPAVKVAAEALDLGILQPESIQDASVSELLVVADPDLLVVVAYGEILSNEILDLAPCGSINVHPSLLPKYRGSTPIQSTILNGDRTGGVTFIQLINRLDAGPVLAQYTAQVGSQATTGSLMSEFARLASDNICEVCLALCVNEGLGLVV